MKNVKYGFTLIELILVMGIILILAGLLFPSLSKAKAAGQTIVCSGNMRQIGFALAAYSSDYDWIVCATQGFNASSSSANTLQWPSALEMSLGKKRYYTGVFAKMKSMWYCPLMNPKDYNAYSCEYISYGNNDIFTDRSDSANLKPAVKSSSVKVPARVMFASETAAFWKLNNRNYMRFRHNRLANCLFLDGHTQPHAAQYLISGNPNGYPWSLSGSPWEYSSHYFTTYYKPDVIFSF